jgi:TRAP-type transport system periplasmic protein
MKKWIVCLGLLVILSLVLGLLTSCGSSSTTTSSQTATQTTSTSAPANKVVLKLAVAIPPDDPMVKALYAWADNFNAATGGAYTMEIYPGGVLAGTADTFAATRTRVVELGHISIASSAGYDPIFGVANLPWVFGTYEANNEFCYLSKNFMSKIMETKFNQKLMASWCMGFAEVYTTKKQIKTMDDFKGLLIACDKPIDAKTVELMGGSPVTMDYTEEFQALQKGLCTGGMATAGGALGFMKYYEVIKYLTISSKSPGQLGVSINLDAWNSLPANVQQIMQGQADKYQSDMAPVMKKFWEDSFKTCADNGVVEYNLPADERTRWQNTCAPIATDFWKQFPADQVQTLQGFIKQANDKYPYK